jgi:uncharacterized protein YjiS (DUF1127 family)
MSTVLQQRRHPTIAPKLRDQVPAPFVVPRAAATQEPLAAAVEAPHAPWRLMLGAMVATLRDWRRRSIERSELARLDARTLRDIGVDPGAVEYEVRQSFWRPRRDWRD